MIMITFKFSILVKRYIGNHVVLGYFIFRFKSFDGFRLLYCPANIDHRIRHVKTSMTAQVQNNFKTRFEIISFLCIDKGIFKQNIHILFK